MRHKPLLNRNALKKKKRKRKKKKKEKKENIKTI